MGWSPREIRKLSQWAQDHIRNAVAAADLERYSRHVGEAADAVKAHGAPCRIHIHSIRRKLADYDGISGKGCIDGIVAARLLPTDSPEKVKGVTFSQDVGKVERTVIEIVYEKKQDA